MVSLGTLAYLISLGTLAHPALTCLPFHPVQPSALVEAKSSPISFVSVQKASLMLVFVALASYSAVSPRTLALTDYNLQFYENLRIVSLAAIVPAVNMLTVFDSRHNDVNAVLNSFFVAFSFGYVWTLVMEIVVTTLVRLAVFCWFEPDIFRLTPSVPVPVLPWVLRDNLYRPKRITLFAADFGTTCVACPIIEEYVKLKLLQWTTKLPRYVVAIELFCVSRLVCVCVHLMQFNSHELRIVFFSPCLVIGISTGWKRSIPRKRRNAELQPLLPMVLVSRI
jgi:hypothetical protein